MNESIPLLNIPVKDVSNRISGTIGDRNPCLRVLNASLHTVRDASGEVLPALIRVTGTQEIWSHWEDWGMGPPEPLPDNWPTETVRHERPPLWYRLFGFLFFKFETYEEQVPCRGWHITGSRPIDVVVPAVNISFVFPGDLR